MKPSLRLCMLMLGLTPVFAGCATGGDPVQNAVYDTHRRVANLDQNLQGSIQQLNQTSAGLIARVDANEQALRAVVGSLEENRAKMDAFERKLDSLIRNYRQQAQRSLSAPGSPTGQSEVEISDQGLVVENPNAAGRR